MDNCAIDSGETQTSDNSGRSVRGDDIQRTQLPLLRRALPLCPSASLRVPCQAVAGPGLAHGVGACAQQGGSRTERVRLSQQSGHTGAGTLLPHTGRATQDPVRPAELAR